MFSGALLVDKPEGLTSFDVVGRLRRAVTAGGRARDLAVGHAGTLDPFATGLLVVCFGEATKLLPHLLGSDKTYLATMKFGEATASGDYTDPVTETSAARPADLGALRVAAMRFVGDYRQVPPMHSAVKKDGKRLYELARQGIEVEREAKLKRILALEVLDYDGERARFRVRCSAGTYVRTLAQDIARALGCLAHLTALRREASGSFGLVNAVTLEAAQAAGTGMASMATIAPNGSRAWRGLATLAGEIMETADVPDELARELGRGQQGNLAIFAQQRFGARLTDAALTCGGRLVATIGREAGQWRVRRVFADSSRDEN